MTSKSAAKKKTIAPIDLEPLGSPFLDDEEDDEVVVPPGRVQPLARNVGSLLSVEPEEDFEVEVTMPRVNPTVEPVPDHAIVRVRTADHAGEVPKSAHAASLYWQEVKRIGPAHAKAALLRKLAGRITQHLDEVAKWNDAASEPRSAREALSASHGSLIDAAKRLEALPLGWAPTARPGPANAPKTLPTGARVDVRDAHRKEYDGALEAEEMVGLTVVRHEDGKPKVACTTAGGSRVVIPRAHLVVIDLAPPGTNAAP